MIRLWCLKTGALLERFEGHQDSVYSVAFSPDGRSIVSGSLDLSLKVWDISSSTLEYLARSGTSEDVKPPTEPTINVEPKHTFCPNPNPNLADHKKYVLSVAFGNIFKNIQGLDAADPLQTMDVCVSGGKDQRVVVWDVRKGEAVDGMDRELAQILLQGHKNSGLFFLFL